MITTQELFNTAFLGVVNQGKQSYDEEEDRCMYRHPDGLKCAVGMLIEDEYYNKAIEGKTVLSTDVIEVVEKSIDKELDEYEIALLHALQILHDNCESTDRFIERAKRVAETYNLTVPAIE